MHATSFHWVSGHRHRVIDITPIPWWRRVVTALAVTGIALALLPLAALTIASVLVILLTVVSVVLARGVLSSIADIRRSDGRLRRSEGN